MSDDLDPLEPAVGPFALGVLEPGGIALGEGQVAGASEAEEPDGDGR